MFATYVSAKRLREPGPNAQELEALLRLAAAAPDHGRLTPWRFILVPPQRRSLLADAFALALLDRDAAASELEVQQAREKSFRAPMLLIAIVDLGSSPHAQIPPLERLVSFGAAIQNILLGAQAMGYGAGLTNGQAMQSLRLRQLCALTPQEHAMCCVNIGTVDAHSPERCCVRKQPAEFMSVLSD
ncbi:MAG: nitroreductase [Comamonadaceae bacterium]|nr:MAG: nitroreductase [Comamonadaceae bacterium]